MLKKLTEETESELAKELNLMSHSSAITEKNMDFTGMKLKSKKFEKFIKTDLNKKKLQKIETFSAMKKG